MDVKRHQPFYSWIANFSEKPMFVPKGMLVAHGQQTPTEVYALRNPPVNDNTREVKSSPTLHVEYREAVDKATQLAKHAEVAQTDEETLHDD